MTQARLRNFVNGKHTDPCEGAHTEVIDPSTGQAYAPATERTCPCTASRTTRRSGT
jgi:hypothetical protein